MKPSNRMDMKITAIVLAAGSSRRMGRPKMILPWGKTTILGQVIETLRAAGVDEILVVTGAEREAVEAIASRHDARSVHNPDFERGEMLSSLQVGIRELTPSRPPPNRFDLGEVPRSGGGGREGVLVCLGDQPHVEERTVRALAERFAQQTRSALVVPSRNGRRGHPWIASRSIWDRLLALRAPESMRDFFRRAEAEIEYVMVDSDSIFADVDTPQDYRESGPS